MEENELSILLYNLYSCLQNNTISNIECLTNELMRLYANCEIIPILLDIIQNHRNSFFRKQAAIGLKICFRNISQQKIQIGQNQIHVIINIILQILTDEQDSEIFNIFLEYAQQFFVLYFNTFQKNTSFDFILNFIGSLIPIDIFKCLKFINMFLTNVYPNFEKEFDDNMKNHFYSLVLTIYNIAIESEKRLLIADQIFYLYSVLYINFLRFEFTDNDNANSKKAEYSLSLTNLLIEMLQLLNNEYEENYLKSLNLSLGLSLSIFDFDIQPFLFDSLFPSLIKSIKVCCDLLQSSNESSLYHSILLNLIFFLTNFLEIEKGRVNQIPINDLTNLFLLFVKISIILFQISIEDDSEPDSYLCNDILNDFMIRIPAKLLREITIPMLKDFLSSNYPPKIYISLLLIGIIIEELSNNFIDILPGSIASCIQHLNSSNTGIQQLASYILMKGISDDNCKSIIFQNDSFDINYLISQILFYLQNDMLLQGYMILKTIIDESESCNEFFEKIYSFCFSKMEKNPSYEILCHLWIIIGSILRNTDPEIIHPHFDEIFQLCKTIIFSRKDADNQINSLVIETVGSLTISCTNFQQDQMIEIFPQLFQLFMNEHELRSSLLDCFSLFITNMTIKTSPLIDNFLNFLIEYWKNFQIEECIQENGYVRTKQLTIHFLVPSINFIVQCVKLIPEKFLSLEKCINIVYIIIKSIQGIFTKHIIAGTKLLNAFIKMLNQSDLKCKEFFQDISMELLNIIKTNDDKELLIYLFKSFCYIIDVFGIEVFNNFQTVFDIFAYILNLLVKNITINSKINKKFLEKSKETMIQIILYFPTSNISIFSEFVPIIMGLFHENTESIYSFPIDIFTQMIIKASNIIPSELLMNIIEFSLKEISKEFNREDINESITVSIKFIYFIINLHFNYNNILHDISQQLLFLIDDKINYSKALGNELKVNFDIYQEYLLALFIVVDRLENILQLQPERLIWLLNLLKTSSFILGTPVTRYIYLFLIEKYQQITNTEIRLNIMSFFVRVFVSNKALAKSCLPYSIIIKLHKIILDFQITDNSSFLNEVFSYDPNLIASFSETMNALTTKLAEVASHP